MRHEKPEVVQFLIELLVHVLYDTAMALHLPLSSFDRDIASLRRRSLIEGESFLTRRLPVLAKALDRALATDKPFVLPPFFAGRKYGNTVLPEFCWPLWRLIFKRDGMVRDCDLDDLDHRDAFWAPQKGLSSERQIVAVRALRQILYLAYKLEGSCTDKDNEKVLTNFVNTDSNLPAEWDEVSLTPKTNRALESARLVIWYCVKRGNPLDIIPGHGPGAVATGEKPWEKYNFSRFYEKLDRVFGYPDYFFLSYSHLCDALESLESMETCTIATAKVVLVPKDSRGPRLISMEPLEYQWIQQGLMRKLVKILESPNQPSAGFVNFTSQEINRSHARDASINQEYDTLDLKDASDRVSLWLVRRLFPYDWYTALCASRTDQTLLPNGSCITLKKFAPMGSACCFPVEALVFWALAVGSLIDVVSSKQLSCLPDVYVYGDDIVTRKGDYEIIAPVFNELNLIFNEDKCCTGRFFRESCGYDAFKGANVVPLRLKTRWEHELSPKALLSLISLANGFGDGERQMYSSQRYVEEYIHEHFGPLPVMNRKDGYAMAYYHVSASSEEVAESLKPFRTRYNKRLQRTEYRLPTVQARTIEYEQRSGWALLYHSLLSMGPPDPFGFSEKQRVGVHTIPHIVKMRGRWVGESLLL